MGIQTLSPMARAALTGKWLFPPCHASLPGKSRSIQAGVIRELVPAFLAGDPRCTRVMVQRLAFPCQEAARPLAPFVIRRLSDLSTWPSYEFDYQVLANLAAEPALPLFARLLADGPERIQWTVTRAFERFGQAGFPWLLRVLRDAKVQPLRRLSAYRLLEQGGALLDALTDAERRGLALTFYTLAECLDPEDQRQRQAVAAYTAVAPTTLHTPTVIMMPVPASF